MALMVNKISLSLHKWPEGSTDWCFSYGFTDSLLVKRSIIPASLCMLLEEDFTSQPVFLSVHISQSLSSTTSCWRPFCQRAPLRIITADGWRSRVASHTRLHWAFPGIRKLLASGVCLSLMRNEPSGELWFDGSDSKRVKVEPRRQTTTDHLPPGRAGTFWVFEWGIHRKNAFNGYYIQQTQ